MKHEIYVVRPEVADQMRPDVGKYFDIGDRYVLLEEVGLFTITVSCEPKPARKMPWLPRLMRWLSRGLYTFSIILGLLPPIQWQRFPILGVTIGSWMVLEFYIWRTWRGKPLIK